MLFSTARIGAVLLALSTCANALHFYLDADEKRCFVEELPSDTVVEGQSTCPQPAAALGLTGILLDSQATTKP